MEKLKKSHRNHERHACGVGVCCVVRKYGKCSKRWETCQNTDPVSGTIWSTMDSKNVRKRPFSPTHCFYNSLRIYGRFPTWGPIPNAPKNTFSPEVLFQRSKPCVGKGPNQRNTLYFPRHRIAMCFVMTRELGLGPNKTAEVVLSVIVQHS